MLIDINFKPARKELRVFGVACAVALCVCGGIVALRHELIPPAVALWIAGGLCGLAAGVRPGVLRWVYVGASLITYPIGFVVSWIVLAGVFYGVIAPIGLVRWLMGHDAMQRKVDRSAVTYWQLRKPTMEPNRYFRQY
jgi:hypothetical protein